jgi:hypothetical protein
MNYLNNPEHMSALLIKCREYIGDSKDTTPPRRQSLINAIDYALANDLGIQQIMFAFECAAPADQGAEWRRRGAEMIAAQARQRAEED